MIFFNIKGPKHLHRDCGSVCVVWVSVRCLGFFLRHLILVSCVTHFHVHPCAMCITEQPVWNKFCQQCLQYDEALHHNQNWDTGELLGQCKWGFPDFCRPENLVKCGAITPVEFRSVGKDILHILGVTVIKLQLWPYFPQTYMMHKDCDMNPQHSAFSHPTLSSHTILSSSLSPFSQSWCWQTQDFGISVRVLGCTLPSPG